MGMSALEKQLAIAIGDKAVAEARADLNVAMAIVREDFKIDTVTIEQAIAIMPAVISIALHLKQARMIAEGTEYRRP